MKMNKDSRKQIEKQSTISHFFAIVYICLGVIILFFSDSIKDFVLCLVLIIFGIFFLNDKRYWDLKKYIIYGRD